MISLKRIVSLFRQTGGGGEFTKPSDGLTDARLALLRERIGDEEPLLVSMRSAEEWFVLTASHFVLKDGDALRRVPLEEVEWVDTGANREYKLRGGILGVRLRHGSWSSANVEAGGPYVGLTNVLMYIARLTGPRSHRALNPDWRSAKTL